MRPEPLPARNMAGIVSMCVGMAMFVANDTMVKLAATEMPTSEIMVLRGIAASSILAIAVCAGSGWRSTRHLLHRQVLLRSGLEALVASVFITALGLTALGALNAVFLTAPLMMTAVAAILLHDRVGWRRWSAVAVGFVGMLVVLRPDPHAFDATLLLGVLAAALSVCRDLLTRYLDRDLPSLVVTLGSAVAVMLFGLLLAPFEPWVWPSSAAWVWLIAAAGFVAVGNYMVIRAFRLAELTAVAPYRYSLIVWATLSGAFVFDERPDAFTGIGIALIAGAGLYVLHRERVRLRTAASLSAAAGVNP